MVNQKNRRENDYLRVILTRKEPLSSDENRKIIDVLTALEVKDSKILESLKELCPPGRLISYIVKNAPWALTDGETKYLRKYFEPNFDWPNLVRGPVKVLRFFIENQSIDGLDIKDFNIMADKVGDHPRFLKYCIQLVSDKHLELRFYAARRLIDGIAISKMTVPNYEESILSLFEDFGEQASDEASLDLIDYILLRLSRCKLGGELFKSLLAQIYKLPSPVQNRVISSGVPHYGKLIPENFVKVFENQYDSGVSSIIKGFKTKGIEDLTNMLTFEHKLALQLDFISNKDLRTMII